MSVFDTQFTAWRAIADGDGPPEVTLSRALLRSLIDMWEADRNRATEQPRRPA
jgi:hypothetical protein